MWCDLTLTKGRGCWHLHSTHHTYGRLVLMDTIYKCDHAFLVPHFTLCILTTMR